MKKKGKSVKDKRNISGIFKPVSLEIKHKNVITNVNNFEEKDLEKDVEENSFNKLDNFVSDSSGMRSIRDINPSLPQIPNNRVNEPELESFVENSSPGSVSNTSRRSENENRIADYNVNQDVMVAYEEGRRQQRRNADDFVILAQRNQEFNTTPDFQRRLDIGSWQEKMVDHTGRRSGGFMREEEVYVTSAEKTNYDAGLPFEQKDSSSKRRKINI